MMFLLGGSTGAGKTAMLHALRARGEQVIDLEALARHRGSAFGAMNAMQPRHNTFVRAVRRGLAAVGSRRVWLEDEGPFIGSVGLPGEVYAQFAKVPVIWLETPRAERIRRLVATYGIRPDLLQNLPRIEQRLGTELSRAVSAALRADRLEEAASSLLDYYDSAYHHRVELWSRPIVERIDGTAPDAVCQALTAAALWEGCTSSPCRALTFDR
jgi:tRNA 2-selenouridine synthase